MNARIDNNSCFVRSQVTASAEAYLVCGNFQISIPRNPYLNELDQIELGVDHLGLEVKRTTCKETLEVADSQNVTVYFIFSSVRATMQKQFRKKLYKKLRRSLIWIPPCKRSVARG
jgi:hypothetical protein